MFKTYLTGKQTFDKNEIGLSRLTFFFFLTSNFAFKLNTGVFGFSLNFHLNTTYKKNESKSELSKSVENRKASVQNVQKGRCEDSFQPSDAVSFLARGNPSFGRGWFLQQGRAAHREAGRRGEEKREHWSSAFVSEDAWKKKKGKFFKCYYN